MTVFGQNFDLYDFEGGTSTVSIGSTPVSVSNVTASQMTLQIPDGTPDDSEIRFAWQDADGQQLSQSLPFRPTSLLLYGDMSGVQIGIDGAQATVESGGLHITGSYAAWSWNTIDLSANMISGIDVDEPADYVLKFEAVNAQNFPLTEDTGLQFCFNWGDAYAWNPGDGLGLNTFGQPRTVSLPLAPMATNGIKSAGEWQTLRIIFQPHAAYEADFQLRNLRIVKK